MMTSGGVFNFFEYNLYVMNIEHTSRPYNAINVDKPGMKLTVTSPTIKGISSHSQKLFGITLSGVSAFESMLIFKKAP